MDSVRRLGNAWESSSAAPRQAPRHGGSALGSALGSAVLCAGTSSRTRPPRGDANPGPARRRPAARSGGNGSGAEVLGPDDCGQGPSNYHRTSFRPAKKKAGNIGLETRPHWSLARRTALVSSSSPRGLGGAGPRRRQGQHPAWALPGPRTLDQSFAGAGNLNLKWSSAHGTARVALARRSPFVSGRCSQRKTRGRRKELAINTILN